MKLLKIVKELIELKKNSVKSKFELFLSTLYNNIEVIISYMNL